ncbi:hypothetical protein GCM10011385_41290 [Nitratireductor aestuarii]|uniref:Uncharacterized protein n=1 Tax=Nitratireductor aestuarii TaxID=1735103 RepID=A0A916WAJ7_9HYPH|nr:DUF6634 family protein [Nitratireductor aestuarii]GGA82815.1 hypothetical protein GCM10011385_41290 [Nitratireductor aestuarii]
MLKFKPGQEVSATFLLQLERLKPLVADMEKVAAGMLPEEIAVPEETPTLDDWFGVALETPALAGYSTGHPRLVGTRRLITTSDLWLISHDQRWARTLSRWYRLGEPMTAQQGPDGK